jgi:stress-induced morphogen
VTTCTRNPRDLIPPETFAAVSATVRDNNPGMEQPLADRIVSEALKFIAAVGQHRDRRMAPSRVVDEGWHALILHTKAYEDLCEQVGGPVHHYPERPDPTRFNGVIIERTIELMAASGYPADRFLWGNPTSGEVVVAANCQHSPPDCQVSCMNKPG